MSVHVICNTACWDSESGLCPVTGKRVIIARCSICTEEWEEGHTCEAELAEFVSLPVARLKEFIAKYVAWIETGATIEVCKCTWEERFPIPGGNVVRMRKDTNFECPVHTKEGLIFHFLTWVEEHGN